MSYGRNSVRRPQAPAGPTYPSSHRYMQPCITPGGRTGIRRSPEQTHTEETMRYVNRKLGLPPLARALGACALGLLCASGVARAGSVTVPGSTDFPESLTSTADGTLFFSSLAGGRIFRSAPG